MNQPLLVWAEDEPDGELDGEEDDDEVVEKLDDENHPRVFNISRLVLQHIWQITHSRNKQTRTSPF